MKSMVLALFVVLVTPLFLHADASYMRLAEVKKVSDGGHMFLYQCNNTGNGFEVEQRYNRHSKSEEIRFVVNDNAGEWITQGISPDIYRFFARKACEESTVQYISSAN